MMISKALFTSFVKYIGNRATNSKPYRDLKDMLTRDNYHRMVRDMFEASIADAKSNIDLDENLTKSLLDDPINRNEIFRWILEGITLDKFNNSKLNLDPYYEQYPRYQDKLIPFFQIILLKIHEYKRKHWSADFLQMLSHLGTIGNDTQNISSRVVEIRQDTSQTLQIVSNLQTMLMGRNPGFEDLKKLLKEGKFESTRERALERLQQPNLSREVICELNSIVAQTYLYTTNEDNAIPYLQQSVNNCDNEARSKRLESIIKLLSNKLVEAQKLAMEAYSIDGDNRDSVETLVNVFLKKEDYSQALAIIDSHVQFDLSIIRAHVLLSMSEFGEVINLANNGFNENSDHNTDWLLLKLDALVLDLETKVQSLNIVNPKKVYEEALPVIEQLNEIELAPKYNQRFKELKAAIYFRICDFTKAQIMFFELLNDNYDRHINSYIACCICIKDWRSLIIHFTKIEISMLSKEDLLLLGRSYLEAGFAEKAIKLLNEHKEILVKDNEVNLLQYHILNIDALNTDVQHIQVVKYIENIEQEFSKWNGLLAINGYYACLINDWNLAIENFQKYFNCPVADLNSNNELKLEYCTALANRGLHDDYLILNDLIITFPYWFINETLINLRIKSLYFLRDYEAIVELYNSDAISLTEMMHDTVAGIYFNYQWYNLSLEIFSYLYGETKRINYILQSARCYYRLGKSDECMGCLIKAERQISDKGSVEDYYLLSLAYKDTLNFEKAVEFAYKVFVQGNNTSEVWGFYFHTFSELSNYIVKPSQEWIDAYHKIFNEFEKKFPNSEPIFKKIVALDDNNNLSQDIINELKSLSDGQDEIRKFYQNNRLPMSFMASFLKRGIFETWAHCISDRDINIWSTSGNLSDLRYSCVVADKSNEVLADIFSLFTLRHLGILESFQNKYTTIYVHQEQFNELLEEWRKIKVIKNSGSRSMSYDKDRVIIIEASSDEVQKTLDIMNEVIHWIKVNGNLVGNDLEKHIKDDETFYFMERTIDIARKLNCSIFIDSFLMSKLYCDSHKVYFFGSFEFIHLMKKERIIEESDYYEHYSSLIMMGYSSLPLDVEVITYQLLKHNFSSNSTVTLLLSYFSKEDINYEYKIEKMAHLLKWLWTDASAMSRRQQLTDLSCDLLSKHHNRRKIGQDLITASKPIFGRLIEHQWEQMALNINEWLKSHIIF